MDPRLHLLEVNLNQEVTVMRRMLLAAALVAVTATGASAEGSATILTIEEPIGVLVVDSGEIYAVNAETTYVLPEIAWTVEPADAADRWLMAMVHESGPSTIEVDAYPSALAAPSPRMRDTMTPRGDAIQAP